MEDINQGPIDDFRCTASLRWPATSIKRSIQGDTPRIIKRVNFEEDAPVDMSQYEGFLVWRNAHRALSRG